LLKDGDLEETMARLLAAREPFYAQADMTLESVDEPHSAAIERILAALDERQLYKEGVEK
jgi:shikimate kinase